MKKIQKIYKTTINFLHNFWIKLKNLFKIVRDEYFLYHHKQQKFIFNVIWQTWTKKPYWFVRTFYKKIYSFKWKIELTLVFWYLWKYSVIHLISKISKKKNLWSIPLVTKRVELEDEISEAKKAFKQKLDFFNNASTKTEPTTPINKPINRYSRTPNLNSGLNKSDSSRTSNLNIKKIQSPSSLDHLDLIEEQLNSRKLKGHSSLELLDSIEELNSERLQGASSLDNLDTTESNSRELQKTSSLNRLDLIKEQLFSNKIKTPSSLKQLDSVEQVSSKKLQTSSSLNRLDSIKEQLFNKQKEVRLSNRSIREEKVNFGATHEFLSKVFNPKIIAPQKPRFKITIKASEELIDNNKWEILKRPTPKVELKYIGDRKIPLPPNVSPEWIEEQIKNLSSSNSEVCPNLTLGNEEPINDRHTLIKQDDLSVIECQEVEVLPQKTPKTFHKPVEIYLPKTKLRIIQEEDEIRTIHREDEIRIIHEEDREEIIMQLIKQPSYPGQEPIFFLNFEIKSHTGPYPPYLTEEDYQKYSHLAGNQVKAWVTGINDPSSNIDSLESTLCCWTKALIPEGKGTITIHGHTYSIYVKVIFKEKPEEIFKRLTETPHNLRECNYAKKQTRLFFSHEKVMEEDPNRFKSIQITTEFENIDPSRSEGKRYIMEHFYELLKFFNDNHKDYASILVTKLEEWLGLIRAELAEQNLLAWHQDKINNECEIINAARDDLGKDLLEIIYNSNKSGEDLINIICYYPPFEELKNLNMSIIQFFHNYTILILTIIIIFITIVLIKKYLSKFTNTKLLARQRLELIWTFFPIAILILIAIPSLKFLYILDIRSAPALTLKVFGAQWYWIYQFGDFENFTINSYILKDDQIVEHERNFIYGWRLLETDVRGILPFSTEVRILISSQDVIHSFSIPGLGIKIDAVPGRLNWSSLCNYIPGSVYGQCSEICGVGHSFMPVIVEFVSFKDFKKVIQDSLNQQ